jgi:Flp pilus assembly protein TadB
VLFVDPLGHQILGVVALMMFAGIFWINSIIKIRV